ncbi:hypothetical protein BC833DRAFT_624784 [Globomyces pollinis-pini]|nr:hypothetical protein BC833DRAFT_624784 [Globomyces pollinis-pini]
MADSSALPELPTLATVKVRKLEDKVVRDDTWMDRQRKNSQAYDYLCHIGEAKEWIEACVKFELAPIEKLDEELRNGIILAYLAKFFQPTVVKRIFEDKKLQYRHSDNINYFFTAVKNEGLPEVFWFELTDLYDKKNIPKVIYCIHALSHFLAKKGKSPIMKNLVGTLEFTDDVLSKTAQGLEDMAVQMPAFGNLQSDLAKEMKEPEETEEEKNARLAREANLERERLEKEAKDRRDQYLKDNEDQIVLAQSIARQHLQRTKYLKDLEKHKQQTQAAIKIQATVRGYQQKKEYRDRLDGLKANEKLFEKIQARYKGKLQRRKYVETQTYYRSILPQVVKLQAWWRGVHARKRYLALRLNAGGADVSLVRQYIYLLDTRDTELEEEKMLEELRRTVLQKIRENLASEAELNDLDAKVALLVKNRISLEEVGHFKSKDMRAALAKSQQALDKDAGVFTLRGNDKSTRETRKKYEQLFYLLQTEPRYLATLMFTLNKSQGGNSTKFLEQVILSIFGYAQNNREEYLFIKLIESCIKIELSEVSKVDEVVRENPLFIKLVLQYTRGAKEREFLRGLLRPLLEGVLQNNELDLDTDPISIYRSKLREEENRTGEKSSRSHDVTAEVASADPEVKETQFANFAKLQTITNTFLQAIAKSSQKMPFGIRYIAMKMKEDMKKKFNQPEHEKDINLMIGNLLYYRYINPVIVAPEAFDVIESVVSLTQRKNLAEIAKTLHQISVSKQSTINQDGSFTSHVSTYLQNASKQFSNFLREATNVITAEEYFDMDEFLETSKQKKHTIYITPDEICQVHRGLVDNLQQLPNLPNDSLRVVLNELGGVPAAGVAAKGPGSEIALNLSNRFAKTIDDDHTKKLMVETKRMIQIIIQFAHGRSLLDILESPATTEQETAFAQFVEKEETSRSNHELDKDQSPSSGSIMELNLSSPLSPSSGAVYKTSENQPMKFSQLKIKALENMAKLEIEGKASKSNHYQSMLDSIVEDVLTKQRRRDQRKREFASLRKTLGNLEEKSTYLNDSMKSYHDYLDSCMAQLTNKKGKVKKPMFLSTQYFHIQDLKKHGKVPKFGSFKFTGAKLYEKGVLLSVEGHSPKQFALLTLTISSDEAGVFNCQVSFLGAKATEMETLRLEDLLQQQYNKVDIITLFDIAKVNLNLLIFLINKKFYA